MATSPEIVELLRAGAKDSVSVARLLRRAARDAGPPPPRPLVLLQWLRDAFALTVSEAKPVCEWEVDRPGRYADFRLDYFLTAPIAMARREWDPAWGGVRDIGCPSDWSACDDPEVLLRHLEGLLSRRKLRLFAAACCQRVAHLLGEGPDLPVLDRAGQSVDTTITPGLPPPPLSMRQEGMDARACARALAERAVQVAAGKDPRYPPERAWRYAAEAAVWGQLRVQAFTSVAAWGPAEKAARAALADLFRDVAGDPFEPAALDAAWQTAEVVTLAQAIYDQETFEHLPRLADALAGAGCSEPALLGHLRSAGPHVRGCWAVDRVLGKE